MIFHTLKNTIIIKEFKKFDFICFYFILFVISIILILFYYYSIIYLIIIYLIILLFIYNNIFQLISNLQVSK